MRILLDECIDESFRHQFPGHECQTCRFAGFKGLSNGRLVAAAEKAGFHVLITVDQNLPYQQNVRRGALSIIVLRCRTTNIDDLIDLTPVVIRALEEIQPGQVVRLSAASEE